MAEDNSYGGNDMQYDPTSGTWNDTGSNSGSAALGKLNSMEDELEVPPASDSGKKKTKGRTKKEVKKIEFKNLEGDIKLLPTADVLKRLHFGGTLKAFGFGKYLSGFYYIKGVKLSMSSTGAFSITARVIKTKFGDNLKGSSNGQGATTDSGAVSTTESVDGEGEENTEEQGGDE